MTASIDETIPNAASPVRRATETWLIVVQVAIVALTALALFWARYPVQKGDPPIFINTPPAPMHQMLIAILGGACAIVALDKPEKRASRASVLGAVLLATACWLTVAARNDSPHFLDLSNSPTLAAAHIPTLAPIVVAIALVLAMWGIIVNRATKGSQDAQRPEGNFGLGTAVLVAGAFLLVVAGAFFLFLNHVAPFNTLYGIDQYQLMEVITIAVFYPTALWLGSAGARANSRPTFLPWALAVTVVVMMCWWQIP